MKIMKRKTLAFLMFFVFLLGALGVCVSAEDGIYTKNIRAINEGIYTLSNAMDGYSEADITDGKTVAIQTNAVIVRYVNKINELRADVRVSGEDLSAEVALITLKGEVSGECAWIFESHADKLSGEACERVAYIYEDTLGKIDSAPSYDDLNESHSTYVKAVILSIYKERISALYGDEDSAAVVSIAETAIREMRALSSTDCEPYEDIFEKAANKIRIQRHRERAISRFAAVYEQINGSGSFEEKKSSDGNISYFLYLAGEADTVETFNLALESSLLSILEDRIGDGRGDYTREVVSNIAHALSQVRGDANRVGEILDASGVFEGISRKIILADKKDELMRYALEQLDLSSSTYVTELLYEYNRDGGIFECCADERVAEFSLKQAKLRADWIAECERYILLSESFFENGNEEIKSRFDEIYFMIDAEMASSLTLEGTRDILRRGRSLVEELCFEFEADGYIFRFSGMIGKLIGDITRTDVSALRKTLLEYDVLSASARALVEDEIIALCQKYRAAIADYLYYIASGEGDRQIALEYTAIIDGTAFAGNAERFVSFCNVLVKKAEGEMRICEIFKGVVAKEEYAAFADKYKNGLRECRDVYLRRIKDMALDRASAETELGIIIRSAELEMLRVYSEAAIASLADSDDSEAVGAIISSAVSDLRFADSTQELEAAVIRAKLEVYRQRAKEELSALKIHTDGSIELLGYIGAQRKSEYKESLSRLLSGSLDALDTSDELNAAAAIFEEYKAHMLAIYENARFEDLAAAKSFASSKINEESARVIGKIENMRYIHADEEARLITEVQNISELALQSSELCASARDVESVLSVYLEELGLLDRKAERSELACAKEVSMAAADSHASELFAILDGLTYISDSLVENIRSEISDNLSELIRSFEEAESVAVVESTLDGFIAALAETEQAAIDEELDSAISKIGKSLGAMKIDMESHIGEMKYLSDDASAEYFALVSEVCENALSQLSAAGEVATAESIWQSVSDAYGDLTAALERDDLASARDQVRNLLDDAVDASTARISSLEYLSDSTKEELFLELENLLLEFSELLQSAETPTEIEAKLAEYRQKIKEIELGAKQENVIEARAYYTVALDAAFAAYKSSDYTPNRYALIKDVYDKAILDITAAKDAESIAKLFFLAEQSMEGVVSIFEDRQAELLQSVNAAYAELLKMSAQYSPEKLEEVAQIKQRALDELTAAESSIGIEVLSEIAERAVADMRSVKLDWISVGNLNADSSGFAEYPAGYDYSVGGIWGVVQNAGAIPSDVRLAISLSDSNKFYKKALKDALDASRVAYVGDMPMSDAEIRDRLEGLEIKGVFSIKLIKGAAVYDEFSGEYTVRILLPAQMRSERWLRVVYISPDGDAEYYDAVCDEGMLVFKTKHFSDFLVLGENSINLLPIIAFLAVIGVLEGLVLIATKAWISREVRALRAMSPVPFAALSVIVPRGGVAMLITLLIIDVTLVVLIIIDIRGLLKMRHNAETARVYALPSDFDDDENNLPSLEEEIEIPVAALPAYLEMVSAEDADSLISDSKANALLIRSEIAPKICRGCKKTFINVDTISENFVRGETVSLKTLKEKGLVSMSTCYIKVLARGVIDKPLTVRAQSFSANAVKMITLTGGSAILEGSDIE